MLSELLVGAVCLGLAYLLWQSRERLQTWERRGVPHLRPLPLLGNSLPVLLNRKNFFSMAEDLCRANPDSPVVGVYFFASPMLVVQSLRYVELILVKDFHHFTDRGLDFNEEKNPLDAQMFFMKGDNRWRAIRHKLTPLFTSGKLRQMYEAVAGCGGNFLRLLSRSPRVGLDLKDASNLFFIDVAGSAIFGLEAGVLENPDSEFRRMSARVFEFGWKDNLTGFMMATLPGLAHKLGLSFNKPDVVEYFVGTIARAVDERAAGGRSRRDFVQLMMELKALGKVEVQQWDSADDYLLSGDLPPTETIELTDTLLMAQAYQFLVAGVDMLALSVMYISLELSQHPDQQEKAREEVARVSSQHGLTYDSLKEMAYLDCVIKESQRLHPTALVLIRRCTKDYTFPCGLEMRRGETLFIPLVPLQRNPDFFPEPDDFRPERFLDSKPPAFFPFGDGPRMCIAMRFAMLQLKFCMATLLLHYRITLNPQTTLPLVLQPSAGILLPQGKVLFDLHPLK